MRTIFLAKYRMAQKAVLREACEVGEVQAIILIFS
jgi:hypothetical protein